MSQVRWVRRKLFQLVNLAYWKDGRDVPDVMVAIMDYPGNKRASGISNNAPGEFH